MMRRDSSAIEVGIEGELVPPQYRLSVVLDHPRFDEALRLCAVNSIELYSRGRVMGWLMSDRTLAIVALAAACLDADLQADDLRSGLTPGRFKAFCVQNRVCSEGRAAAVLAFLRLSGHVEAETHPADRRITRLRPSPKLLEMVRTRLRSQIEAAALIFPELGPAILLMGSEDFERRFYLEILSKFNSGMRLLAPAPQLRLFADRDVGVLVLLTLSLETDASDEMPPSGPMKLSIAGLARRYRVSRTHILRMVRDAEAEGLLTRVGEKGEMVCFSPQLREGLRNLIAAMFQYLTVCATAVLPEAD